MNHTKETLAAKGVDAELLVNYYDTMHDPEIKPYLPHASPEEIDDSLSLWYKAAQLVEQSQELKLRMDAYLVRIK